MQSLTRAKPQEFDYAGDGSGRGGAQGLFQRPLRLPVVLGCDKEHACRIEPQSLETMSVRAAIGGNIVWSCDDEHRSACAIGLCDATEEGGRKTEGRRHIGCNDRCDFVQRAEGQAPLRQMLIESGKAEGKRGCFDRSPVCPRQHPAKVPNGLFTGLIRGFGIQQRHDGKGFCISFGMLEQNKNNANRFLLSKEFRGNFVQTVRSG
ncbi:hypothetical protein DFP91_0493 [Pseudorhodoplanes sinuspersici]|nr:hypothetical protein DFP91_0493 [Pseudorhodoplanes sinuspersici]